jgi:hypothetical protein
MGEGNDFVELLCWPAVGRLLIVSPYRMYPNRAYPCQDQPFQDVPFQDQVAGPHAKTVGIQFESCRGHFFWGELFAITTDMHGMDEHHKLFESVDWAFESPRGR